VRIASLPGACLNSPELESHISYTELRFICETHTRVSVVQSRKQSVLKKGCAGEERQLKLCPSCSAVSALDSQFCNKCGAALDGARTAATETVHQQLRSTPSSSKNMDEGRFPPGTLLAQRYRIVSLLGRGGMGEVYRANDLLLGQTVALKFLPVQWTSHEQTLTRFRNEVRIARQISHPNVCRVYDIGEAEGSTYLSMEYVDGEDLASLLRRIGRLPQDKALEIARQLCAGLAAAHDKGVVHRDLKPGNIMLDGQGQLRITDFGLAGVAGDVKDIRSGTPGYMAPEQRSGQEVTARSDIYALGVVLHEVFTGKRPSADSSHPDLAIEVDRVIRRCLAEDPAKRPASPRRCKLRPRCREAILSLLRWRQGKHHRPRWSRRPGTRIASLCGPLASAWR